MFRMVVILCSYQNLKYLNTIYFEKTLIQQGNNLVLIQSNRKVIVG